MLNYTRIKRLYIKEMLDILRDRRALIAMIVVPIVLYPLLMLGSIQAATLYEVDVINSGGTSIFSNVADRLILPSTKKSAAFGGTFTGAQWFGVLLLSGGIFGLAIVNIRGVRAGRARLQAAVFLAVLTGVSVAVFTCAAPLMTKIRGLPSCSISPTVVPTDLRSWGLGRTGTRMRSDIATMSLTV